MMNNNKILTVSYGTFSCTLEGFDDSFGTMKAIAEYFRDLAADDRYFGAEPPQPDVDMLARIAQKEISRRVEAREHDGTVVLTALEGQPAEAAPGAAPAAAVAATAATALMPDAAAPQAEPAQAVEQPGVAAAPAARAEQEEAQAAEPAEAAAEIAQTPEVQADEAPQGDELSEDSAVAEDATDTPPAEDMQVDALAEDDVVGDTFDEVPVVADLTEDTQAAHQDDPVEDAAEIEYEDVTAAVAAPASEKTAEDEIDIVPGQPDADVEAFFASNPTDTDVNTFEEVAEQAAFVQEPMAPAENLGSDSIAAKLQRIRAVVAQHDEPGTEDDYAEDEHAQDDIPDLDAAELYDSEANGADEDDAEVSSDFAEAFEDSASDADVAEVIADLDADADQDDAYDDATSADNLQSADGDALNLDTPKTDADDFNLSGLSLGSEPTAASDAEASDDQDDEEDDIAAILSRLDQAESDNYEDTAADTLMADDMAGDDESEHRENLFEGEAADAASDAAQEELRTRTPAFDASKELRVEAQDPAEAQEDGTAPPRARVIKVKRADLENAIERGELEEYDAEASSDAEQTQDAPQQSTTSLSEEDEADLARELAALEATMEQELPTSAEAQETDDDIASIMSQSTSETMTLSADMRTDQPEDSALAGDDWTDEEEEADHVAESEEELQDVAAADHAEEEETPTVTGRDALPSLDAEQGSDMSRLLAETDQQMDEPESATRRDAFAHLRAAVAAKKADDALGVGRDTVEGDDKYRNDLADVVRPRRPDVSGARTPRPGEGRPAPLKLVAEQRIDVDNPMPAGPVRPRRVVAVDVSPSTEGESFAEFANEMGATTLAQQLEAAAAYMSFVEGREQFSRPQLMTKVRQLNAQDGFSREDTLRHFGQLLRAGKIEKLKGGRFTVSEDIGFRPDQRAAS